MSLVHHKDIPVLIAVNEKGVFVIDHIENVSFLSFFNFYLSLILINSLLQTLLLGLKYEELCWDLGKPSGPGEDPDSMSCIFVQFDAIENGIAVTKLMQIFSRQANMMDALIAHFADQMRRRRDGDNGNNGEPSVHDGELNL